MLRRDKVGGGPRTRWERRRQKSEGATYFAIAATLSPRKRAAMNQQQTAARAKGLAPNLAPRNRAISLGRSPDLAGTLALTVFVAVIGRYVFRLRL